MVQTSVGFDFGISACLPWGCRGSLSAGYLYMLALFQAPKWKRYHPTDLMTVGYPTLTGLRLLGDFRLGTQGKAEAAAVVAVRRDAPVPVRRPTTCGVSVPIAATDHAVRAVFWASRIADGTLGVFTVSVAAPVPDVPVHVV